MSRLVWLADELRKAGLAVVEVDGWKTRGSDEFAPEGVTWHATAGSRKATAQGEVHVLLNGSTSAPPPIAQLMIYRDGRVYVVASGRCNHNLVGWAGPNKGLGNTRLLGIEMANDNLGEPWPAAQLDAARRATAAIMRRLGADPMRRLAGHYEHQPAAGHPAGATSFKTDPLGVHMPDERPRVAALMNGEDDMATISQTDFDARMDAWWNSRMAPPADGVSPNPALTKLRVAPWQQLVGRTGVSAHDTLFGEMRLNIAKAAGDDLDEAAIAQAVIAALPNAQAIADAIPAGLSQEVVDLLASRLAT
jgi:hypothetical protein